MKTLDLLGGVASGEILVSGQLAAMDALFLNADHADHDALRMPTFALSAVGGFSQSFPKHFPINSQNKEDMPLNTRRFSVR